MASKTGPTIATASHHRLIASPPGAAISATPRMPSPSPTARIGENRSIPSTSAIGKAISGTVEIRIDITPAGQMHHRRIEGRVRDDRADEGDHHIEPQRSPVEDQPLASDRRNRTQHDRTHDKLPEDQPEGLMPCRRGDLAQGLGRPPTHAQDNQHEDEEPPAADKRAARRGLCHAPLTGSPPAAARQPGSSGRWWQAPSGHPSRHTHPDSVASPPAGSNRLFAMPVMKRRRGSSFSIPMTLS